MPHLWAYRYTQGNWIRRLDMAYSKSSYVEPDQLWKRTQVFLIGISILIASEFRVDTIN